MEEIQTETPVAIAEEVKKPKQSWKEWLGTDEAVRWVYLIFGLCAIVMLMVLLQFSTDAICCGDWDGYYHIRWSSLLWENFKHGHWLPEFKWLPLTVLNARDYADHHFLFHLLQIPFLWFFEPVMAAKIAAVFYGSLAIFSVYWMIFYYKIDNMLLWFGALLTCSNPFFYRMNMAKAPPLTIIISVIGIYLLFERKYVWLMPLMFLFVWTYSLFPLLLIAALIWTIIIAWNERKFDWRPLVYTGGGMILGNIINPYFPQNIWLFVEHFVEKLKIGDFVVPVGGEWYPYSGVELLTHFPVAMITMLIGYVLFAPKGGKLPEKSTFFLAFVTILLVSQFRSKRFAEYFPPFAILFAAFTWQVFTMPRVLQLPEDFKKDIEPYLDAKKPTAKPAYLNILKQSASWTLGIIFAGIIFYNFIGIDLSSWADSSSAGLRALSGIKQVGLRTDIKNNEPNAKYQRAMTWFSQNIPEGEMLFNSNWDDFPKLFYLDQKHTYAYGLDPNYLYSKNPELFQRLTEITGGKVDDPAPEIRDKFGAKYIFADAKENEDFLAKALESGWCEKAYDDDEAIILRIRDQKGEPPKEANDDSTPDDQKQMDDEDGKSANDKNTNQDDNDDNDNE